MGKRDAILDDKDIVPLEPKTKRAKKSEQVADSPAMPGDERVDHPREKPRPPKAASERVLCIGVKRDAVGWRMIVARIPESTLDNHVIERTEPDVFEMTLARVQSKLLELIYK